ncbi:MAG: hypothetical protein WA951_00645, partial [Leeuwenhoekiella sp.]
MIFRFIKYISCCSIVAFMPVSCNSPAYIQGELDGIDAKGATLYLIKPENLGDVAAYYLGKVIDSAIVNADGKFIFENLPSGNSPVLLELAVK